MRLMRTMAAAVLLGLATAPALAQAPAGVAVMVDGAVAHGGAFDAARLAQLPQQSPPASAGSGGRGVLLWDLLRQADPVEQPVKNPGLRNTVLVTGRDGYAVAFSFGELDPAIGADAVLLTAKTGTLQLLVPGDRTRTRNVHDVVRISVQ